MRTLAVTYLAGGAGVALWFFLAARRRAGRLRPGDFVLALGLAGLACRLAFALLTPTFKAPDEHSHLNFIRYVDANDGELPVQEQLRRLTPGENNWEYHQPPLYYALMVPFHRLLHGTMGLKTDAIVRGLRLASVAIWILVLLQTVRLLERLGLLASLQGACTLALVCLLPTYVFISSVVNNDGLLVLVSVVAFNLLVRAESNRDFAMVGVVVGLAIWAKQNGVVLGAAAAGMLLMRVFTRETPLRRAAVQLAIVTAASLVAWAPVAIRNILLYGSVTGGGYYYAYLCDQWTLPQVVSYLIKTFLATSGELNDIVGAPPKITVGLTLAFCAMLAGALVVRNETLLSALRANRCFLWGGFLATLFCLLIVVQIAMVSGTGQGRHMFPVLVPIGMLVAAGLDVLRRPNRLPNLDVHIAGVMAVMAFAFTAYSLATLGEAP
ncbi:MAG: glycosyltransferase family 39 protein [bacterium]